MSFHEKEWEFRAFVYFGHGCRSRSRCVCQNRIWVLKWGLVFKICAYPGPIFKIWLDLDADPVCIKSLWNEHFLQYQFFIKVNSKSSSFSWKLDFIKNPNLSSSLLLSICCFFLFVFFSVPIYHCYSPSFSLQDLFFVINLAF